MFSSVVAGWRVSSVHRKSRCAPFHLSGRACSAMLISPIYSGDSSAESDHLLLFHVACLHCFGFSMLNPNPAGGGRIMTSPAMSVHAC